MTTHYDRATAERLAREADEDDGKMTPGPWWQDDGIGCVYGDINAQEGRVELAQMRDESLVWDAGAIARTRNNLRAIADQLAAAVARIDELETVLARELAAKG